MSQIVTSPTGFSGVYDVAFRLVCRDAIIRQKIEDALCFTRCNLQEYKNMCRVRTLSALHFIKTLPKVKYKVSKKRRFYSEMSYLRGCSFRYLMHDVVGVRLVVQTPRSATVLRPINLKQNSSRAQ